MESWDTNIQMIADGNSRETKGTQELAKGSRHLLILGWSLVLNQLISCQVISPLWELDLNDLSLLPLGFIKRSFRKGRNKEPWFVKYIKNQRFFSSFKKRWYAKFAGWISWWWQMTWSSQSSGRKHNNALLFCTYLLWKRDQLAECIGKKGKKPNIC